MARRFLPPWRLLLFSAALLAVSLAVGLFFLDPLLRFYDILTDREAVGSLISEWGAMAPFAFMLIQILQVIIAPVPGEISGFAGGYLFGAGEGFLYSSLALTAGSAINFWIGRFLGFRFVRQWIPSQELERMDVFLRRQGIILVLAFFIFPGFPKDYLSLFLGGTAMPFKVFILLAGFGRMPGTLLLSLQGGLLFEKMYGLYGLVLAISLVFLLLVIHYRQAIYAWAERIGKR
jgi:uncharacterized membrane protein YdjX (TVP38/TMEM64 family)